MAIKSPPSDESLFTRAVRPTLQFVSQNRDKLLRWFSVGLAFMGISTALLYGFVDLLGLSVPVGSMLTAEASTLLRFFINHYWVFGLRNPTISNCIHYHIANAGAFALWWIIANVLTHFGMYYLLAGIVAVACSTLFSFSTNFFWIWRKHHPHD